MKKRKNSIVGLVFSIGIILLFGIFSCNGNGQQTTNDTESFKVEFGPSNAGGTVTAMVDGKPITSPAQVEKDKTVIFTAVPTDASFVVEDWGGATSTGPLTAELVIRNDMKILVRFKKARPETFRVEFGPSNEVGTITATVDGNSITSPAQVEKDKTVIFTASLTDDTFFVKDWGVASSTSSLTAKLVVTKDENVQVEFKKEDPELRHEFVSVPTPSSNIEGKNPTYPVCEPDRLFKGVFVEGRNVRLTPYSIGKHELTYKLWHKVRVWGEENGYKFENAGTEGSINWQADINGSEPTPGSNQPVVGISWRDCIVWCNAYTEMKFGSDKECVYRFVEGGDVLKDSTGKEQGLQYTSPCDTAFVDMERMGYRLPTEAEWEFAARYQPNNDNGNAEEYGTGIWLSKLWSLSGASKPMGFEGFQLPNGETWQTLHEHSKDFGHYYQYFDGTGVQTLFSPKTFDVMTKQPNALGIFDMSGNVSEWCFDEYYSTVLAEKGDFIDPQKSNSTEETSPERVLRGGDVGNLGSVNVVGKRFGWVAHAKPLNGNPFWGVRLARR